MKKCKECGTEISSSAKVCPHCGKNQNDSGCLLAFFIIFGLIIIGSTLNTMSENVINRSKLINSSVSSDNSSISQDRNSSSIIENNTYKNTSILSSRITKENYDKIKTGMTEVEIEVLLGEPESISENEIDGYGKTVLKHYQDAFSLKAIDVYFYNGKVSMKNWTDL